MSVVDFFLDMPLGIYIQVPFCQTKCTYCNFPTGVFSSNLYAPYVDALCRELREHEPLYRAAGIGAVPPDAPGGRSFSSDDSRQSVRAGASAPEAHSSAALVDTVYVGGGTPSLLDPAALARILDAVRSSFVCALEEVTLEADPETVTAEKAAAWRAAGISRVSFGAQSFNDAELKAAGRLHRRADIFAATRLLRAAGFAKISFDLIAGLPHQTSATWEDTLENLLGLRPEHVSVYMLEIDEGSRLGREVLGEGSRYSARALPSDDEVAAFYERACERLAAEGYEHYEISNWALPGFASRHNLKYWRREAYLGFGAGAHSFNGLERWANAHDPAAYVLALAEGKLPIEQLASLSPQHALEEELFLGLRQLAGVDFARLEREYHVRLAPRLERLREAGLVEIEGTRVRLAPARLTVSNEVFVALLS